MKNEALFTAEGRQTISAGKEVLYLCDTQSQVHLQEVHLQGGNIAIKGVCEVEVLYATAGETQPFANERMTIPFAGEIEAGNVREGDYIDAEARVYRTQSSMADAMALQCRVEIQVTIMAFERNRLQIPDDLVEEPLDLEKLQKEPGMIGYVVQEGDDLWSIAKHFHTTRQELMETNDLTQETLQKGQKLLVMKHIYLMS